MHTAAAFIFAIALLIGVHEFGHFIVARKLGIKVEKFSIGFGPKLISWHSKDREVEYIIAMIPLGGYVKMLGEQLIDQNDPQAEPLSEADKARAFNHQPVWKRAAVAAAGPMFNFFFAIVVYMCVAWIGQMVMPPVIGSVAPGSVAERSGLKIGDTIEKVNHQDIHAWSDVEEALKSNVNQEVDFQLLRADGMVDVHMHIPATEEEPLLINVAEDVLGISMGMQVFADNIAADSPAAKAGMLEGDQIVRIDNQEVHSVRDLIRYIQEHAGEQLAMGVLRDELHVTLHVVPKSDGGQGKIGVRLSAKPLSEPVLYRMDFFSGVAYGFVRTAEMTQLTLEVFGKMISTAISPENLGGPIAIAQLAGRTAEMGLVTFLMFLALISVNLGVLNLLPVPILDGGHLVYLAIEKMRGSPLPASVMEKTQIVGVLLVGMLMIFAFYNDLMRLFRG